MKDGVQSHCRLCVNAWRVSVYHSDETYRASVKATCKKSNAKIRQEMIDAYGGKCACCGETEPKFMTVDHIGGGGQKHRNEIGEGGSTIAKFLKRNNYPTDKFRLLCFNCNCAIGFFGACPHTTRHTDSVV